MEFVTTKLYRVRGYDAHGRMSATFLVEAPTMTEARQKVEQHLTEQGATFSNVQAFPAGEHKAWV